MDMDRHEIVADALIFADRKLGPHSRAALQSPVRQARILARTREGAALEDAVLSEIHRAASEERRIADEFVGYFLSDLLRVASRSLGSGLRRLLDTGDLVQSVLGDVWPELASIRFESRAAFLSLLSMRIRWKVTGHARSEHAVRRGGGRQMEGDPADLPVADPGPGPSARCALQEDRERLVIALLRLEPRDREALTRFLRGETSGEIAEALDLSVETARKVLQRAMQRARRLSRQAEGAGSAS
jgi:RNA polymerase sigma factor (sigma-70 family)